MSVLAVTKMWSKSGGSITSKQYSPTDLAYKFTEGYQVVHDVGDHEGIIISHQDVPKHGNQHYSGAPAFVTSVDPQAVSPILTVVTIGYTGEAGEFEVASDTVDVEWTDTTTTEGIDRDFDGNAIVNVNGEPVDGLSMDVADQVVVITRKFSTINTYAIAQYRRSTNSDTFLNWPPGTARLIGFSAKNQFTFGAADQRWTVTARIQFREPYANTTPAEAWYQRWRNEGLYVKIGSVVQRARINGQEAVKPVLHKADGTLETDPANAVFNHTKVYGSLPYSALGLI
jgi:hypothetical protein